MRRLLWKIPPDFNLTDGRDYALFKRGDLITEPLDVPSGIGAELHKKASYQGFVGADIDAGPSDQRTPNPAAGERFLDTRLGITIIFDGRYWRNPCTGEAV